MGGVLSAPITDKNYNQGEGLGLRYGLCSMQGWRTEMEDAHDVKIGLKYGLEDWSYFAVFDGHAGKRAAAFAAWNLLEFILRDSQLKLQTKDLPGHVPIEPNVEKSKTKEPRDESSNPEQPSGNDSGQSSKEKAELVSPGKNDGPVPIKTKPDEQSSKGGSEDPSHPQKDTDMQATNQMPKPELISLPIADQLITVKEAIRSGFLRIDESMRAADDLSGCTAICVLISPTHLFIANCGDSRAVLYDGMPSFATEDHKPLNPNERQRIVNAGGLPSQRINGTLAVSRALGDFEFKKDHGRGPCEQLVSPEPEVTAIKREKHDQFLILACDGIWDVMDNFQLGKYVSYKLRVEKSIQNVCSSILDLCLNLGSRDNMSIIIVVFENGPKYDEEARKEEEKSDKNLVEFARQLYAPCIDWLDFIDKVSYALRNKDSIKLPPGGGIESKYGLLQKVFEEEQLKSRPEAELEE